MCGIQHTSICVFVCFHSRVLQTVRAAPPENTGQALQTQKTSSIHRLATLLRNGEEMGRAEWVGSKLSAFRKEDKIFIYSIQSGNSGRAEMGWGCGGYIFCYGHLRWSALTCTNLLYPVLFSHPSTCLVPETPETSLAIRERVTPTPCPQKVVNFPPLAGPMA